MTLKSWEFKNFIQKSMLKPENSLWVSSAIEGKRSSPQKLLKYLHALTQESKILWTINYDKSFKGIVLGSRSLSGFKLEIRKECSSCYSIIFSRSRLDIVYKPIIISMSDSLSALISTIKHRFFLEQN